MMYAEVRLSVRVSEDLSQSQIEVTENTPLEERALNGHQLSIPSREVEEVYSRILEITGRAMVKRRNSCGSI